jgi:hypothetical protein
MNYSRYTIVFLITLGLFAIAFFLSDVFSDRKVNQLREMQERIAIDILSTETRFALLGSLSCDAFTESYLERVNGLTEELATFARKLKAVENELGGSNQTVINLKNQYTLLQMKDYLLMQDLNKRCDLGLVQLVYFFDTDCRDCSRQSIVLDYLQQQFPMIRMYWIERDLESVPVDTLIELFDVRTTPALVINGKKVAETFYEYEELVKLLPPELFPEEVSAEEGELVGEKEIEI